MRFEIGFLVLVIMIRRVSNINVSTKPKQVQISMRPFVHSLKARSDYSNSAATSD